MHSLKITHLSGFGEKLTGLIGVKSVYPVFFTTRWGIHTFGMKVPIDMVILDNTFRIVKLTHKLPPNRIFLWNPRYDNVLELPPGEIKKRNMNVDDSVNLL